MKKVRLFSLLSLLALLVIASSCAGNSPTSFGGKSLERWLKIYADSRSDSDAAIEARAAIRTIGTNAVPKLLQMFRREDQDRFALIGFEILGEKGAPAIPELATMLLQTNQAVAAAIALDSIGAAAFPALNQGIESADANIFKAAAFGMRHLGTNASQAIPLLLKQIHNPDSDFSVYAADALGDLAIQPEIVVPALTNLLAEEKLRFVALNALGGFGEAGRPALSVITPFLQDPDRGLREMATNTIMNIAPEMLPSLGLE